MNIWIILLIAIPIIHYAFIGVFWGAFAFYMQRRIYPDAAPLKNVLCRILNTLFWPVCIVIAYKNLPGKCSVYSPSDSYLYDEDMKDSPGNNVVDAQWLYPRLFAKQYLSPVEYYTPFSFRHEFKITHDINKKTGDESYYCNIAFLGFGIEVSISMNKELVNFDKLKKEPKTESE